MDAFERLRADGRIRALGVSNFGPKEMAAARQHGVIDVLQPPYNMLWREVEAATLPYCREHNIGVMPYSGLAQGLLTGALSRNTAFVEGDERRTTVLFQPGTYERALDAVEGLRAIAAKYGQSVAQLAIQSLTAGRASARRCSALDCPRNQGKRWQRRMVNRRGRRRRDRPIDATCVERNRRQRRHVRVLGEAARGEGRSVTGREVDPRATPPPPRRP